MGILDQIFMSPLEATQRAYRDQEEISRIWEDYIKTIPAKESLIKRLSGSRDVSVIDNLMQLFSQEFADISSYDTDEKDILQDISHLRHDRRLRSIRIAISCFGYLETRHKFFHELMRHLFSILRMEYGYLVKLKKSDSVKESRSLAKKLEKEFELEVGIIREVSEKSTFIDSFAQLVRGERKIGRMERDRKKLKKLMEDLPGAFLAAEQRADNNFQIAPTRVDSSTYKWVFDIFNTVELKIRLGVMEDILEQHPDMHLEFVNRPEFGDLVRDSALRIFGKKISETRIKILATLFREWYNKAMYFE